jgi:putative nucleotidyltransferase with HDIG domain
MSDETKLIAIDQLRIGMFIKLDLNWFQHSFSMNSFKITNEQQMKELRALKLKHIRYVPSKSDLEEAPIKIDISNIPPLEAEAEKQVFDSIVEAKRARFEKLKKQREEIARCEEKFVKAAGVIRDINKSIFAKPAETIKEAGKLIDLIADGFVGANDNVMHLIQNAGTNEDIYFHNLNVSVLAMMLASEMKCNEEEVKQVGMAALFHDLGKTKVPDKILLKVDGFTKAETDLLKLHTQYGVEIAAKVGLPKFVAEAMANHHEHMDGSGYPRQLKGDAISKITRIITITPHEALSNMYAHRRAQFDPVAMATLVKSLGVYPPGTLVRLSNEAIGLVMNVNVGKPLRPRVLVYDADIPKEDAMILDLADETADVAVSASIRPGALPKAIFDYLNPRKRVNYYAESKSKQATNATAKSG